MNFFEIIAAFFYLQPSLIINFVPMQIIFLMFCLIYFKKMTHLKAFFHALVATISATIIIFLTGFLIVPFIYVRFFQLIEISYNLSLVLFVISVFMYWLWINFYLHYAVKLKNITQITLLSSAIAGFSVLALYYLLW